MNLAFVAPALPLHAAGKYVAGAYIVFVLLILVYVVIMAKRLATNQRELAKLQQELAEQHPDDDDGELPSLRSARETEQVR